MASLGAPDVERFGLVEIPFEAAGAYSNRYTQLEASAVVTRPAGDVWRLPLFWDGGNTWKLRISPDAAGRWHYRISSPDKGLDRRTGSFDCVPSNRPGGIQPMTGYPHHFQYQNGQRFWFMGDTAWGYVTNSEEDKHGREQSQYYVKVRASQGFNVIHTMMMSEQGVGNDGGFPFTEISAEMINPAYWQEVDRRIAYANEQGVAVGLALAWGDKRRQEPFAWRMIPGVEARQRYARYIGARYGAYNVYFIVSGEWHAERNTRDGVTEDEVFDEFVAIGNALDAADPHERMIGIHPMTGHGSVREFNSAPWMSFGDYQQTYQNLHERAALSRYHGGPVVNSEYGYHLRDQTGDGQPDKANSFHADDMRQASWDIVMAGAYLVTGFGTTYFGGHRDPGPFHVDAPRNDDWEEQIGYIQKFFEQVEYWRLIPASQLIECETPRTGDRRHTYTDSGRTRTDIRPPETVYWALAIPGETYIVYARGVSAPIILDPGGRPGEFRVSRYDPRTGQTADAGIMKEEGRNARFRLEVPDADDWVILLDRVR